ncbi:MAG: hypothetical protein IK999_16320 [Ruminococcus sp.]|nr:hypothetical protein [Ruminococcus sp.]MBQ1433774.1 hypothetical protein [Ruminococcus sp.]
MKKFRVRSILAAIWAAGMLTVQPTAAFALGDVELDCTAATVSDNWAQSAKFTYSPEDPNAPTGFDATRMTEDSVVRVSYELIEVHELPEGEATGYPVELVFQSWSDPDTPLTDSDGRVWATVAPSSIDEGNNIEYFKYSDIAKAYGTNDFGKVDRMLFSSTNDAKMKVTSVTVTECKETGDHWVASAGAEAERASRDRSLAVIVGGTALILAMIMGIIWFILGKKTGEAFDLATGEFIDKRDAV